MNSRYAALCDGTRWDALVFRSGLEPLRRASGRVRREFLRAADRAATFDAAFLARVAEAAAAPALGAADAAALYFPFDPYGLPASRGAVERWYRSWDDGDSDSDDDGGDDDDSGDSSSDGDDASSEDDSRMPHSLSPSNMEDDSRSFGAVAGAAPMSLTEPSRLRSDSEADENRGGWAGFGGF